MKSAPAESLPYVAKYTLMYFPVRLDGRARVCSVVSVMEAVTVTTAPYVVPSVEADTTMSSTAGRKEGGGGGGEKKGKKRRMKEVGVLPYLWRDQPGANFRPIKIHTRT